MIPVGLRLEQAPPVSVPLRFFLTAPAFALLAALLALWQGEDLFASRWAPATLAATHLLVLGFAAMVMAGALMQIVPVLAGSPIPWPRLTAAVVHASLTLGTLAIAAGFLFEQRALLKTAVVLLGLGFAAFLSMLAASLARLRVPNDTSGILKIVASALAVTVALGLWLAAARSWGIAVPAARLHDVHPAWGLLGWTGLLIAGVAFRVVPMFQMTPAYPAAMVRASTPAVLGALVLWTFAAGYGMAGLHIAATAALAGIYVTFAAVTLWLLHRRRRRLPDVGLLFWRAAMVCALAAPPLWALFTAWEAPPLALMLGVAAIVGVAHSVISGMLYKIVPFLAWFHLQARAGRLRPVPNMRQFLAERWQRRQFWLHVASLILLVAAPVAPEALARPAALTFAASALLLQLNLLAIAVRYARERRL